MLIFDLNDSTLSQDTESSSLTISFFLEDTSPSSQEKPLEDAFSALDLNNIPRDEPSLTLPNTELRRNSSTNR